MDITINKVEIYNITNIRLWGITNDGFDVNIIFPITVSPNASMCNYKTYKDCLQGNFSPFIHINSVCFDYHENGSLFNFINKLNTPDAWIDYSQDLKDKWYYNIKKIHNKSIINWELINNKKKIKF